MKRVDVSGFAYHVYVANRGDDSVRTKWAGRHPGDQVSNIAIFHLLSRKPMSEVSDSFLYLDRWCGNPKVVTPVLIDE